MKTHLIAAIGNSRQLAWNNRIPFYHPDDMSHFKQITTGHCLIMGRNTMKSLPQALGNRVNIFLSRSSQDREGFVHRYTLNSAFDYASTHHYEECFIIGGAELYRQTLPLCHTLYLSIFDYQGPGDVFFPKYLDLDWITRSTQHFPAVQGSPSFTLQILEQIPTEQMSTCHF